jgi:hypothetical protein
MSYRSWTVTNVTENTVTFAYVSLSFDLPSAFPLDSQADTLFLPLQLLRPSYASSSFL